ncbi:MAG TPA: hypothetical protein VMZ53_01795 [Kofleriaceae bacterium]|nr:hypothetical protein [Kofleriaceae bacterium]
MRTGLILLSAAVAATPAAAETRLKHHTPGVQEDEINTKAEVEPTVAAGTLLPWSIGARHERQGILLGGYGGADLAKRAPVMAGTLDATLIDRVTLHATMTNVGMSNMLRPNVGLLVDVMRTEDTGVDLAVGGDYDIVGFNGVPAVVARTAIGANAGSLRLQGNAGFGLGLEQNERFGQVGISGLTPVAKALYVGIDSRARMDLERDDMEPSGELDWDMQAGPVATLALGRFAVSATGGVSAWKQRTHDTAKVGAVGAIGVGAAF